MNKKLKKAFREINHEKYDELMRGEKEHRFSREFMDKCTRISTETANTAPKKSLTAKLPVFLRPKKRHLVFIAVVLAMFVSVSGFCRVAYIGDYVFYIYPTESDAYYRYPDGKPEVIDELYYIPEEAGVTKLEVYDEWFPGTESYGIIYEYNGEQLFFEQFVIPGMHSVNTEFYMPEVINVGEYNGYYLKMKFDCAIVFWTADDYCFQLLGKDDKEALIEIAKYVKPVQK